ncbi:MAG: hypothetical protein KAX47_15270 [Zoogloea sp.]|nr:hypothetical protein [Zoogloea sp.]
MKEHIIGSDSDADFRVQRAKGVDGDALALTSTASTAARSALPKDFLIVTETRLYPAARHRQARGSKERRQRSASWFGCSGCGRFLNKAMMFSTRR